MVFTLSPLRRDLSDQKQGGMWPAPRICVLLFLGVVGRISGLLQSQSTQVQKNHTFHTRCWDHDHSMAGLLAILVHPTWVNYVLVEGETLPGSDRTQFLLVFLQDKGTQTQAYVFRLWGFYNWKIKVNSQMKVRLNHWSNRIMGDICSW